MDPTSCDRPTARALAEKHFEALKAVAAAGGNAYQAEIDQRDKLAAALADWPPEQREQFWGLYAEEAEAVAAAQQDANLNAAIQNINAEAWGVVIGGVILFLVLLWALNP